MDAVEFLFLVQESKPLHIPSDVSGVRRDLEILHGGNEPFLLLLKIPRVCERQRSLA